MTSWTVQVATEPAYPDRANEDLFAEHDGVAILLDGAGLLVDLDTGCTHGVPWFVTTLAAHLLDEAADRRRSLTDALARAIDHTAGAHRTSCDLTNPNSPSSTVTIARLHHDTVDFLVLADSTIVYGRHDHWRRLTDTRIDLVANPVATDLAGRHQHMRLLADHRNQPGGFWVASTDPCAATHSYTTTTTRSDQVQCIALLSDGAARLVDTFHLADWNTLMTRLLDTGPAGLIRDVREAENADPDRERRPRTKTHDDATAAILQLHR